MTVRVGGLLPSHGCPADNGTIPESAGWLARSSERMVSMSLREAIDRAVDCVRAHPDQMTRAEVDEFYKLADEVYVLAFRANLADALPRVPELRPQLESDLLSLPPVQFESKLNLPGDWDNAPSLDDDGLPLMRSSLNDTTDYEPTQRAFLVCASPRWFHDMETLRALAELCDVPEAESEQQVDGKEWILVSEALTELPFLSGRRALYKFAKENPSKLHLRSPNPQAAAAGECRRRDAACSGV